MSTNFDLPICPNTLEKDWKCARSDVYLARVTDTVYVFVCRTCRGTNVMPKKEAEARGRYNAGLMATAREQQQEEELRRKRAYSFGGS